MLAAGRVSRGGAVPGAESVAGAPGVPTAGESAAGVPGAPGVPAAGEAAALRPSEPRRASGPGPRPALEPLGTWVPPPPEGAAESSSSSLGRPAVSLGSGPSTGPRVVTLPHLLDGARLRVRPRAVAGLILAALIAAAWLGMRVAAASRAAEPAPVAPTRSGLVGRSLPPGFTGLGAPATANGSPVSGEAHAGAAVEPSATGSSGGSGPPMVVHVVGQVARPGVVRLPAGARVLDAVDLAGGALPDADLRRLNLARALSDGEQVLVPSPSDPPEVGVGSAASTGGGSVGRVGAGGSTAAGSSAPVNLNTADLTALDTLPGVGPVLAQRIVDWRSEHGRFTSVDELGEVAGIGPKLLAQIAPRVTL